MAKRSIGLKGLLIKQALATAAHAYLVGVFLGPDRPTHLAMPAPTEGHRSGTRNARRQQAHLPDPTRLLLLFAHTQDPKTTS